MLLEVVVLLRPEVARPVLLLEEVQLVHLEAAVLLRLLAFVAFAYTSEVVLTE
jgi:hypothetical protein